MTFHLREAQIAIQGTEDLLRIVELVKSGDEEIEPAAGALTAVAFQMIRVLSEEIQMNSGNDEFDTSVKLSERLRTWVDIHEYAADCERGDTQKAVVA